MIFNLEDFALFIIYFISSLTMWLIKLFGLPTSDITELVLLFNSIILSIYGIIKLIRLIKNKKIKKE